MTPDEHNTREDDEETLLLLRAAVDAQPEGHFTLKAVSALMRVIDARDAALREKDAEIAQLKAPGSGHNESCLDCESRCSSLAGNPNKWPVYLGDGWRHVGCVRKTLKEAASLRAVAEAARSLLNVKRGFNADYEGMEAARKELRKALAEHDAASDAKVKSNG